MKEYLPVTKALISVWDKTGLDELALKLNELGVTLYATQGTSRYLKEKLALDVTPIETITQFPEMMEGRVKTLHPKIFGGILARRQVAKDLEEAKQFEVPLFDLVIGNLYPFGENLHRSTDEQSGFVDIGGPSLLRAAAKNHAAVTVLSSPNDYPLFFAELAKNSVTTSKAFRQRQAAATFLRTAQYDGLIASAWAEESAPDAADSSNARQFPSELSLLPQTPLRYGENPHQKACWVGSPTWKSLQGKELSFNNLLDAQAAAALVGEFSAPTVVIVKHGNPCGVASARICAPSHESQATDLAALFSKALACDEKSAFGGIVAVNLEVDAAAALRMSPVFFEVILAPAFSPEARDILSTKKNLRLIEWRSYHPVAFEIRAALDGWLVQDLDREGFPDSAKTVTDTPFPESQWADIRFAWLVAKHVKSNAIVIAKEGRTLGIGAGQMSRIDSVQIAISRSDQDSLKNSVLASDAFFPFRDSIDVLKDTGISTVVQPGGSQRDAEVIQACNEHGIAMVFTGQRHFRH